MAYAVILLTPDDAGRSCASNGSLELRARQNVVFEFGYFIGKLGRRNVCGLKKGELSLPSDYSGVLYIEHDDRGAWKLDLVKEMKQAGLHVDVSSAI